MTWLRPQRGLVTSQDENAGFTFDQYHNSEAMVLFVCLVSVTIPGERISHDMGFHGFEMGDLGARCKGTFWYSCFSTVFNTHSPKTELPASPSVAGVLEGMK